MKRKLKDWAEMDLVYARRWYKYLQRPGETRRIKRLMHKRWRREDKALVCYEATYPSTECGEPREVLQDRRGYTSVDEYYFWEYIHPRTTGREFDWDWEPAPHTSQSEGFDNPPETG